MFDFSFEDIFDHPEDDYPLLTTIDFGKIDQLSSMHNIIPISCTHCGALVFDLNDLKRTNDVYSFSCRFCLEDNKISKEKADSYINLLKMTDKKGDFVFILEEEKKTSKKKKIY